MLRFWRDEGGMLGISLSLPSAANDRSPSNPPATAILDHDGTPIHDESGDFILED